VSPASTRLTRVLVLCFVAASLAPVAALAAQPTTTNEKPKAAQQTTTTAKPKAAQTTTTAKPKAAQHTTTKAKPKAAHPTTTKEKPKAVPCWVNLLNDWYDGVINNTYPLPCYNQALKHLPAVAAIYGGAREDIIAARNAAAHHKPPPGESQKPPPTTTSSKAKAHGVTRWLDALVPGNPNSFPTPLLILGLLAILLVIAGAIGMLWQRSHPRDDDAPESDATPTP
jgi:hypothetical protein